ncbi:TPR-like protein, partial [Exidia glandulosa HHB12029]
QAPWKPDSQFPAARDKILPELSNLDALLLSEIQNFDEPPSTDLIKAVNAISDFSRWNVPNGRLLTDLIPRIEDLPKYLASSLSILAGIHWHCHAYDLSLEAGTRARSLYQSLRQRSDAAGCDHQLGNIHRLKGNFPEAIASLSAARETFNELDRELDVAYCDRDLALVFYEQGNYDDAAALFTSVREVFVELDEPAPAAFCQEWLGDIHRMDEDYQAAEKQIVSALQTYTSLGLMSGIASCSCTLGDVYGIQQRFDAALERLQVAYDIGQKQGNTLVIANALRFRS